jgi:signal transduction histidine kinase
MADRASIFLLVTILVLVVILLVFAMKYAAGVRAAQLRVTAENTYRDLAARAVKAQEESAAALTSLKGDISRIEDRLERVEKILKEVE